MKSFAYLLMIIILGSLSSCTEVITLDLNDSESVYVIEANLNGTTNSLSVLITESGSFTDPGTYSTVSDAMITLREQGGESLEVYEVDPGKYFLDGISTTEGAFYELSVTIGEEEFVSSVEMPASLAIDSVTFERSAGPAMGEGYGTIVHYSSEESPWLRMYIQSPGQSSAASFVPFEGAIGPSSTFLFQTSFSSGQQLQLEMQVISEQTYRYLEEIAELSGEGFGQASAAPSNPEYQWSGEALGYFSAYTSDKITAIVP